MADGSYKNIEDVQVGECVKGKSSDNNVIEIRSHPVGSGVIFSINRRVMFTGDHPFLGVDGNWKVLNPDAYEAVPEKTISNVEKLRINDVLITETGQQKVMRIDVVDRDSEDMVYDLVVDGDMTYIADGFVVHTE